MGTALEWLGVLLAGGFWGGMMLLFHVWDRKSSNIKPALSPPGVLLYAFAGLLYGLGVAFHSRIFHWPLVLVAASAVAGAMVAGWFYRRSLRSQQAQ